MKPTRLRRDSIINPKTGAGSSRDKTEVARPNVYVVPLNDEELRTLFTNNGVARRIVDVLPRFAVRKYWTVQGLDPAEDKALRVRSNVYESMLYAQLYGGSALLVVTEDDVPPEYRGDPSQWLAQPLELDRVNRVLALHAFDTFEAHPLTEDRDIWSPNYREPEYWSIGSHGFYATVHRSRVLHFKGRLRLPSERWTRSTLIGGGTFNRQQNASILQAVYAEIRNLNETARASALLAMEAQKAVMKIAGLDDLQMADAEQVNAFRSRMREISEAAHILGVQIIGADDEYSNVGGTSQGFEQLYRVQVSQVAIATGLPQMVLAGEQAGFGTDGEASWEGLRQSVSAYQEDNRPQLERLYQIIGAAREGSSEIDPHNVRLTFNPLSEPGDLERAQVRLVTTQADVMAVQHNILTVGEVRGRYTDDEGFKAELDPVDPDDLDVPVMGVPPLFPDVDPVDPQSEPGSGKPTETPPSAAPPLTMER